MACKPKFSTEQVIAALVATRGLISLAAQSLRCDQVTVRNYIKRYPTVAQAFKDEREALLDIGELKLIDRVHAGEGWAVCFLLKTLGKERGYIERQEFTGKDGKELEKKVNIYLPENGREQGKAKDDDSGD